MSNTHIATRIILEEPTVLNIQKCVSFPWRTLVKQIEKPIVGLLLTMGLATSSVMLPVADSKASDLPGSGRHFTDGIYLYGQSTEPQQIGSEYLVFEVNQGKVVGGFYMPRSSFDCFYGNVESNKIALTVIDSYEQTPHSYNVALQSGGSVAQAEGTTVRPLGLEGYHRLDAMTEIDQQVLSTCVKN
jgi:hypothetical protein